MSKREPSVLLDDIRTSIEKIQRYTAGLDEDSFLADEKTIDAVAKSMIRLCASRFRKASVGQELRRTSCF